MQETKKVNLKTQELFTCDECDDNYEYVYVKKQYILHTSKTRQFIEMQKIWKRLKWSPHPTPSTRNTLKQTTAKYVC